MAMNRAELLALCLLQFTISISFRFLQPLFPLLAGNTGVSPAAIGFLMGSNAVIFVLFSVVFSFLYARVGYLVLLLFAFLASLVSIAATGFVQQYETLLLVRALGGLHGAATGVMMAYVSDRTSTIDTGKVMGQITGSSTLGRFLGPMLLLALSSHVVAGAGPQDLTKILGITNTVIALPALVLLATQGNVLLGRAQRSENVKQPRGLSGLSLLSVITFVFVLITSLFWLLWNGLNALFPLISELEFQASIAEISIYYALGTLLALLLEFFVVGPITRHDRHLPFLFASVVLAAAVSAFAVSLDTLFGLGLALLYFTAASTALRPLLMDYAARIFDDCAKGLVLSMVNIALNLAQMLGPMLFGYLYASAGLTAIKHASLVISVIAATVLLVGFTISRRVSTGRMID